MKGFGLHLFGHLVLNVGNSKVALHIGNWGMTQATQGGCLHFNTALHIKGPAPVLVPVVITVSAVFATHAHVACQHTNQALLLLTQCSLLYDHRDDSCTYVCIASCYVQESCMYYVHVCKHVIMCAQLY